MVQAAALASFLVLAVISPATPKSEKPKSTGGTPAGDPRPVPKQEVPKPQKLPARTMRRKAPEPKAHSHKRAKPHPMKHPSPSPPVPVPQPQPTPPTSVPTTPTLTPKLSPAPVRRRRPKLGSRPTSGEGALAVQHDLPRAWSGTPVSYVLWGLLGLILTGMALAMRSLWRTTQ